MLYMDRVTLSQNADFLQIALEEMENGNDETAREFVEEVYQNMVDELE